MRISGIDQFLGGADNVKSIDIIRGEQLIFEGVVKDSDGDAMNISDFTITAVAEFYKADVTIVGGKSMTINDFAAYSKSDKTLTVTKNSDASTGKFTLEIPNDLAADSDTADLNAATEVLVAAVYITYNDGGSPATIRKSRMIIVIRHSG